MVWVAISTPTFPKLTLKQNPSGTHRSICSRHQFIDLNLDPVAVLAFSVSLVLDIL